MRSIFVVLCAWLAGCGGRVAAPVALSNSFDVQLSCAHIEAEYAANRKRTSDLIGERGQSAQNNVGLLIISPLFLDFSSTIQKELRAIQARDKRLAELGAAKSCPISETAATNISNRR